MSPKVDPPPLFTRRYLGMNFKYEKSGVLMSLPKLKHSIQCTDTCTVRYSDHCTFSSLKNKGKHRKHSQCRHANVTRRVRYSDVDRLKVEEESEGAMVRAEDLIPDDVVTNVFIDDASRRNEVIKSPSDIL